MNVGAFDDPEVIHVDDTVDPIRDLEIITEELRLKVIVSFGIISLIYWVLENAVLVILLCKLIGY